MISAIPLTLPSSGNSGGNHGIHLKMPLRRPSAGIVRTHGGGAIKEVIPEKVVIFGASGMLGHAIRQVFPYAISSGTGCGNY